MDPFKALEDKLLTRIAQVEQTAERSAAIFVARLVVQASLSSLVTLDSTRGPDYQKMLVILGAVL
jgi:hypothetical protein